MSALGVKALDDHDAPPKRRHAHGRSRDHAAHRRANFKPSGRSQVAASAGIYNRSSYEREVRAALGAWHDHVRSLVEGGERKVIFMQQAAS